MKTTHEKVIINPITAYADLRTNGCNKKFIKLCINKFKLKKADYKEVCFFSFHILNQEIVIKSTVHTVYTSRLPQISLYKILYRKQIQQ